MQGGCFLVALAPQELTKGQLVGHCCQWWNYNSGSAIPYSGGIETNPTHVYVEISEWLVDVAGVRKREEIELVLEGAGQSTSKRFSLVSLTSEEVEALVASESAVCHDSSDNRERAIRIAKQLAEDIRDI